MIPPALARARLALRLQASARAILRALAPDATTTFVRSHGNTGDQLIEAGVRRLLAGRPYEEVAGVELGASRGELAVVAGGGAWCAPYHEFMPELLPQLEKRFRRVVVLPSSFDPDVEPVRRALSRTSAVVFARERESYERIRQLCDARLAHDCALYFDFAPYRRNGTGVLQAFRTDKESRLLNSGVPLPDGNRDISLELTSLESWLDAIAAADTVRTDRAHVLIAAAMLGKQVEIVPSSYYKVTAIARHSLAGFPIRAINDADVAL